MDADSPASRTALRAARHRAAHQLLEGGVILADPLAVRVLGEPEANVRSDDGDARMRWFVCARARYAEEALAEAVAGGVDQLVVLGAGLDTFGYRSPFAGLRVVELDHPATQAWKLERLSVAGIEVPATVSHVPVDFERDDLGAVLADALDPRRPLLCWWLGVTPYLTVAAVTATLRSLGSLPSAGVVLDHALPPGDDESPSTRALAQRRREAVAALGEPWVSQFTGPAMESLLRECGFDEVSRTDPAPMIRERLGLPPAPGPGRTRVALATTRWPAQPRS